MEGLLNRGGTSHRLRKCLEEECRGGEELIIIIIVLLLLIIITLIITTIIIIVYTGGARLRKCLEEECRGGGEEQLRAAGGAGCRVGRLIIITTSPSQ